MDQARPLGGWCVENYHYFKNESYYYNVYLLLYYLSQHIFIHLIIRKHFNIYKKNKSKTKYLGL